MSKLRSFGTQCETKRNSSVQTKRLSNNEIRHFSKIIDKEKQVLLKFLEATKGQSVIQPIFKVNAHRLQTRASKHHGTRKKMKRKAKRKHASLKTKQTLAKGSSLSRHGQENEENNVHYVSKIVVDDSTHSVKLSFRSCNARKRSSDKKFKENETAMSCEDRARSRKAKQPRRVCRVSEDHTEFFERNDENFTDFENEATELFQKTCSPNRLPSPPQKANATKETVKPESTSTKTDCTLASSSIEPLKPKNSGPVTGTDLRDNRHSVPVKQERTDADCSLASIDARDKQHPDHVLTPPLSEDERESFRATWTRSDDEESNCSEEFSIIEANGTSERNAAERSEYSMVVTGDGMKTGVSDRETGCGTEDDGFTSQSKLKEQLKGNLIQKQTKGSEGSYNEAGNRSSRSSSAEENDGLPQVVSVHFYDPQNQCQRVVDANTHITQYAISDGTHVMLNDPTSSTSSPSPPGHHPAGVTSPDSIEQAKNTPSQSPPGTRPSVVHAQVTQTSIPPIPYHHPSYYQQSTGVHTQPRQATYARKNNNLQDNMSSATNPACQATSSYTLTGVSKIPPATSTDSIQTQVRSFTVTSPQTDTDDNKITENDEISKIAEVKAEIVLESRSSKRKQFIFGSHEPPRKKVISSLLTPLCEREATRLADGIHEINMQYFPLRSLAQKAANRVSGDTDDVMKLIEQKIQLKTKMQDVEKARNLLKDIYDMVLKSKEIEDIQNFELVSHSFGVRNILNHLSLVDLYFGELGTELQSKI